MNKYLLKRLLYSLFSIVAVMAIIMILIFSLKSRDTIFANDPALSKMDENSKEVYKARRLQEYGYLEFVEYSDYIYELESKGLLENPELVRFYNAIPENQSSIKEGALYDYNTGELDGEGNVIYEKHENPYLIEFREEYEAKGYKVIFLNKKGTRSSSKYYAIRDYDLLSRLWSFFSNMFYFETVNDVDTDKDIDRYIRWEWDSISNAPALVGSGTTHKYLIYFDDQFPFIHQNWFHINLGKSNTGDTKGKTIEEVLNETQGSQVISTNPYPGQIDGIEESNKSKNVNFVLKEYSSSKDAEGNEILTEVGSQNITTNKISIQVEDLTRQYKVFDSEGNLIKYKGNDYYSPINYTSIKGRYDFYFTDTELIEVVNPSTSDFHTATFNYGNLTENELNNYDDNYTKVVTRKDGLSRIAYSFIIGIFATILSYFLGVPIGIWMARRKDKLVDKLGMMYIIFIIAVPSLAYIYIFMALGKNIFGLPTDFGFPGDIKWLIYVLPVISLALPSVGSLMKWTRRYMIDQSNSDYVKFARSQGLSEGEIFVKHIAKNAAIPLMHGIPGSILGCLTGAFITEKVYGVPGTGKLLTEAINQSNNGTIVALAFFYSVLSIISLIAGDILLTWIDPRISFSEGGKK